MELFGKKSTDVYLKYKPEWTKFQRYCADEKCKKLSEAETLVTKNPTRDAYQTKKFRNDNTVPKNDDVDHMIDLQL